MNISESYREKEWCAVQGLNLRKTANSFEDSNAPSQRVSQNLAAFNGLDLVVESWLELPSPLRTAILSIVSACPAKGLKAEVIPQSNFPDALPSASGESTNNGGNNKQEIK